MIIYKTTNLINGMQYIGKDSKNNPKYLGSGVLINKAIKKYGRTNFKKEILETCTTLIDLIVREKYWIDHYDAVKSSMFYNLATGGDGGPTNTGKVNCYNIITGENRMVSKNKVSTLIRRDWVLGISKSRRNEMKIRATGKSSNAKGRIWIHTADNQSTLIKPENLSGFINRGWLLGLSENHKIACVSKLIGNTTIKGRVAIHNDKTGETKMIYPIDKQIYIETGWMLGRFPRSNIQREKQRLAITNRVWVHNTSIQKSKLVKQIELSELLNNHWTLGMLKKVNEK